MTKTPTHYFRTPVTAPGPLGQTMVRSMGAIRRNPLSYLNEVWRQHGDVVQFPIPRPPTYLVNSPEGVRRVLVDNARNYGKSTIQYRALSLVTGDGLLTSDGPTWRTQRRVLQPAFHHDALADLGSHVAEATARIAREWQGIDEHTVIDADAFMMNAALEVVAGSLMSTDLTGQSAEIAAATLEALDVVIARARVPITPPSWLPTPANRVLKRSVARLDAAVSTMMSARSSDPGADLLGMLLSVRDENDQVLSVEEIRDQLVTFIVAGHETVASALGWAWGLLAEHPAVADAVASEAEDVAPARAIAYSDFPHLTYSRAVVEETLRLYPPAAFISRTAQASDTLCGRDIKRKDTVILPIYALHRHHDLWDRPDQFDPERFANGYKPKRYSYLPFGDGPRICIGAQFAMIETVIILSTLISRYKFTRIEGRDPKPVMVLTLRPDGGVPLKVTHL